MAEEQTSRVASHHHDYWPFPTTADYSAGRRQESAPVSMHPLSGSPSDSRARGTPCAASRVIGGSS
jgi:hypothetical protein